MAEGADRPGHLALRAPSREAVDEVLALARAHGAEVLHELRVWPEYHPGCQEDPVRPTPRTLGAAP